MDVFLVFGMVVFHAFSKELVYTPLGKTSIHVQLNPTSLAKLGQGEKTKLGQAPLEEEELVA